MNWRYLLRCMSRHLALNGHAEAGPRMSALRGEADLTEE
jgi:hypothetical protein